MYDNNILDRGANVKSIRRRFPKSVNAEKGAFAEGCSTEAVFPDRAYEQLSDCHHIFETDLPRRSFSHMMEGYQYRRGSLWLSFVVLVAGCKAGFFTPPKPMKINLLIM